VITLCKQDLSERSSSELNDCSTPTPPATWQEAPAVESSEYSSFQLQQNFPPVFFLDPKVFRHCRVEMPTPISPIPSQLAASISDIRHVAAEFFGKIHLWMPIISKKRFYEKLLNPLMQPRIDVMLLVYCMRLITVSPSDHADGENPKTSGYLNARRFLLEAEVAGILSLQLLQAGLLVTMYEVGHAIYPSAYTSLGTWVRYGVSLGINRERPVGSIEPFEWLEEEERRRVWWAILILDRYVFPSDQFVFIPIVAELIS
jgi:hypothetical protein